MNNLEIPLFPLNVVLFPGMVLPLHIFEERYKLMIQKCLEEKKNFGVVFQDKEQNYRIGCLASIETVFKDYSDGRRDIITKGQERFEILSFTREEPFPMAIVKLIGDDKNREEVECELIKEEALDLYYEILELIDYQNDFEIEDNFDIDTASFLLPAYSILPPIAKQKYLEMTSTCERLQSIIHDFKILKNQIKKTIELKKSVEWKGFIIN
jgi:Lon protease-like protein